MTAHNEGIPWNCVNSFSNFKERYKPCQREPFPYDLDQASNVGRGQRIKVIFISSKQEDFVSPDDIGSCRFGIEIIHRLHEENEESMDSQDAACNCFYKGLSA